MELVATFLADIVCQQTAPGTHTHWSMLFTDCSTLNHSPKKMTIQTVFMIKLCVLHWQTQEVNLTQVDQPQSFYKRNALPTVLSWIGGKRPANDFFGGTHSIRPLSRPHFNWPQNCFLSASKCEMAAIYSISSQAGPALNNQQHTLAANGPAFP